MQPEVVKAPISEENTIKEPMPTTPAIPRPTTPSAVLAAAPATVTTTAPTTTIELTYFPEFNVHSLYLANPQPVVISYFESVSNFSTQLHSSFLEFDVMFSVFQKCCTNAWDKKLTLKSEHVSVPNLALAARFYDDKMWYRAKIGKH